MVTSGWQKSSLYFVIACHSITVELLTTDLSLEFWWIAFVGWLEVKFFNDCVVSLKTMKKNTMFIIGIISEWAIQIQKYVHIYFRDYAQAFDKLQHNKTISNTSKS